MMTEHVYKKVELTGTSKISSDDAVNNAIAKASASLKNIDWFEVVEIRGTVKEGQVGYWQATLKVGFRLIE
jgi:flavin-binding protein dodecin